ncbi:MAG: DegT/DnrJ/EryC1/StrS family aminotransferase [Pseudomonadota bacterium]
MKVDFYRHGLSSDDAGAVADVLGSPFLTTGKVAGGVEERLRTYFGVEHALLVNSWTNGALAVLLALGIRPGDEIVVPAMTFIASANVGELLGARTVMVDVDPETLLVTPEAVAAAVTPRTRAVIPVHLYGQMVDMQAMRRALDATAPGQKIALIEDCAHCFEGQIRGTRPGAYSDAAVFSFYATKNVTCGEGGAVICRDAGLSATLRETRLHGMSAIAADRFAGGVYNHWDMHRLGTKANLPDLLAALLSPQIDRIDALLPRRAAMAARYRNGLAGLDLRMPADAPDCVNAWHLFTIGVGDGQDGLRDRAIAQLNEAGISVTVNYRALPAMGYYAARYPDVAAACPVAMRWGGQTISLPFYPGLPSDQQDHVIETLHRVIPALVHS